MSEWWGHPGSERPGAYLRRLYEDGVWTWGEIFMALTVYLMPWRLLRALDNFVPWCWCDVVMLKLGYDPRDIFDHSQCFAWAPGHNPGHCYCGKFECVPDPVPEQDTATRSLHVEPTEDGEA